MPLAVAARGGVCYILAVATSVSSGESILSWLQVVALGLLQGLTEFIPVSSTGHLALFPALIGQESPSLFFDVAVHLGTLVAAIVFYAKDVGRALKGLGRMVKGLLSGEGRRVFREDQWARLAGLLAIAILPTVAIALALDDFTESMVTMPMLAASCMLITGTMLIVTDRIERRREAGVGSQQSDSTLGQAAGIGIGQGIAILPGISRSGACIITGILLGLEREFAVRFAFLLMIPTVLGAACYQAIDVVREGIDPAALTDALAAAVAMISGLAAIWITVKVVQRRWLWVFGVYCLVIGIFSLVFLSVRG